MTLYHNPRCSKSRQALELLRNEGIEPQVIEYLKAPLSADELLELSAMLDTRVQDMARRNEPEYQQAIAAGAANDREWAAFMAAYPKLMERPIAVKGKKAVMGRPPERVLELL